MFYHAFDAAIQPQLHSRRAGGVQQAINNGFR
jgi:hypothetical protein